MQKSVLTLCKNGLWCRLCECVAPNFIDLTVKKSRCLKVPRQCDALRFFTSTSPALPAPFDIWCTRVLLLSYLLFFVPHLSHGFGRSRPCTGWVPLALSASCRSASTSFFSRLGRLDSSTSCSPKITSSPAELGSEPKSCSSLSKSITNCGGTAIKTNTLHPLWVAHDATVNETTTMHWNQTSQTPSKVRR